MSESFSMFTSWNEIRQWVKYVEEKLLGGSTFFIRL